MNWIGDSIDNDVLSKTFDSVKTTTSEKCAYRLIAFLNSISSLVACGPRVYNSVCRNLASPWLRAYVIPNSSLLPETCCTRCCYCCRVRGARRLLSAWPTVLSRPMVVSSHHSLPNQSNYFPRPPAKRVVYCKTVETIIGDSFCWASLGVGWQQRLNQITTEGVFLLVLDPPSEYYIAASALDFYTSWTATMITCGSVSPFRQY